MISQSNIQNYQWLTEAVIHKLFNMAFKEFNQQTYDINKIARQMILFLQQQKGSQTNYNHPSSNVSQQIISFCSLLGATPKYFLQLLNEELITSNSYIVTINNLNEEVTRRFFNDFKSQNCKAQSLPNYFSNEQFSQDLYCYVNVVAKKFCKVYEECSKLLKKDIGELTGKIKTSKIMNNYMLYKIFREISVSFKKVVQEKCQETVFRNCPYQVIEYFFHYIINKFQVVKLVVNQEITNSSMFEPSPLIFFSKFQNNEQIELSPKEAVNSDGKFAIFIKTYSENPEIQNGLQDYMLILDEKSNLKFVNCKTLRKKWFIMNDIKLHVALTMMARQYIIDGQFSIDNLRKSKQGPIQKLVQCQPLEAYTNYNGVIGRSLYLMKRYTGVSEFFKDLSKRAILTRSMEQIMCQIPIIGYMIMAGTFSSNFYHIFSNKFSTDHKKFKQFGQFMLSTTTTVGTSILGAVTGQMLIPIPFVGALIGSVIGGFIGEKGGKQINSWIQKKKFRQIINYLKKSSIDQQHWECNPQFYKALEIKEQRFQQYIPTYAQDYVFATLIAFVLICFYQSKRLNIYNLQKSKKINENKQKIKGEKKRQRQFQEQIKKMNLEQDFETQFNIMKIVEFLQDNNGYLYEHYEILQKSILNNLVRIIN